LFFPREVIGFAAIRMLQTGVVAVVIPLVMANFVSELAGTGIAFSTSIGFWRQLGRSLLLFRHP
jgi:hypothetical protein